MFSQQIQYLKGAAEEQTLAVCASSCFMTPETVEVCQMLQTGMILQCTNSEKKQEDFQTLHYVTHCTLVTVTELIPFLYHKNCIRYSTFNKKMLKII
jgi:hypothetical protein